MTEIDAVPSGSAHPFLSQPRFADMMQGVAELDLWINDLLQQGLAILPDQPPEYWEFISKKMVDLKLPGLGRRINRLHQLVADPGVLSFSDILSELADIGLLIRSFGRIEELPAPMQREILQQLGWNVKKDELEPIRPVHDHWLVMGVSEGEEDKLRLRKTWLWPYASSRPALLLEFAWGKQPFSPPLEVGRLVQADMTFYPGTFSFRVQAGEIQDSGLHAFKSEIGDNSIRTFLHRYGQVGARNPWIIDFPVVLNEVLPVYCKGNFVIVDRERNRVPLKISETQMWRLMLLSAGNPLSLFGEWDGEALAPISILGGQEVLPLELSCL